MIKEGRKYVSVSFDVKNKKKIKKLELLGKEIKEREDLIKKIQDYGFSRNTIMKIISDISDFEIEQAILSVNAQVQNGNVKNAKAMLRTALKEKWKPDVFDAKKLKKKQI
jgi:hypothetical protein